MPCQIIFCLKENNAKKINSHRCESPSFLIFLNVEGSKARSERAELIRSRSLRVLQRFRSSPRAQRLHASRRESHSYLLLSHFAMTDFFLLTSFLQVGTRPGPRSSSPFFLSFSFDASQPSADLVFISSGFSGIYKLWKVFDNSSNVGGACGEIAAFKDKGWRKLLNPLGSSTAFALLPLLVDSFSLTPADLPSSPSSNVRRSVASQNFEYKVSSSRSPSQSTSRRVPQR